jgi:ATP synthase protein I
MPSPNGKDSTNLTPAEKQAKSFSRQFAMAMELPFVIVAAIGIGGLIGFFLDRWLHTKPVLMLIFGTLGFVGGVRDVLRRIPANDDGKSSR